MNKIQQNFVQEALGNIDLLNQYEIDFIDNISKNYVGKALSAPQNKFLNKIHDKIMNKAS